MSTANGRRVFVPVGLAAWLVVLWLFLWGDVSIANVASGAVVAAVLLVVFPQPRPTGAVRHVVRFTALARLTVYFVYELLFSNLLVAREIVSPRSRIRTGVVACPLRTRSDGLVTTLANVLALSPGTMMVEVLDDPHAGCPPTMYVHALLLHDVDRVRVEVAKLEALVVRAFGSAEEVAGLGPEPAPQRAAAGGLRE